MTTSVKHLFALPPTPAIKVRGCAESFPVHRIFCVGRNYEAHAREMGQEVDREAPFYFTKPASAFVPSGQTVAYPPGTKNFHYEMELVIAIGQPAFNIPKEEANGAVLGYAAGLDMTRRDLQLAAREKGRPWDLGKAFEDSGVISEIVRASEFSPIGQQRISLKVNDQIKQDALLSDLIWSVPEIVSHLSKYYHLIPGDVIFTGTPEGVGPVQTGDHVLGEITGLPPVDLRIGSGG